MVSGVTSGIRATLADLYELMASSVIPRAMNNSTNDFMLLETGIIIILMTDKIVPVRIYGILRPILEFVLSDSVPNKGSNMRASTLSAAMKIPVIVSLIPNVFLRIRGTTPSYNCQNEPIVINARPTRKVRL